MGKRWEAELQWLREEAAGDSYGVSNFAADAFATRSWAVDIGANLGLITIQLLKTYPSLRVLAIEPSPSTFRYLLWNLRANGVADRCWALNVAIADTDATSVLFEHATAVARSNTWHQGGLEVDDQTATVRVPTLSIAGVLRAAGLSLLDVRLMKVDCEGCE